MKKQFHLFLFLIFSAFFSCKKSVKSPVVSRLKDTLQISYYPNKKVKELLLSEHENHKNVQLYYSETGLLTGKTTNFNHYPQNHYEYENNRLVHQWTEGNIGGCIAITGKEFFWNAKGSLIKETLHIPYGNSCSEKILIHEIKEFFENTKTIKSIQYTHESYEGSAECPCGIWKNLDPTGKIISQQEFPECKNNVSCEEAE